MAKLKEILLLAVYEALARNNFERKAAVYDLGISYRNMSNYIKRLRQAGYIVPHSKYAPPHRINRRTCEGCGYFEIQKDGVWICYMCKYIEEGKKQHDV